jgi:hypothetical protein
MKKRAPSLPDLDTLKVEREQLAARTAKVDALIAAIENYADAKPAKPVARSPVLHKSKAKLKVTTAAGSSGGIFHGKGLGEASAKQISLCNRIPQSARQVWAALSAAGVAIMSANPESAVSWALRKREKKVGDVILIGDGKFGLTEWYSDAEIKAFKAARTPTSSRDHDAHVERTKAGIENAVGQRGVKWGRPQIVAAEKVAKFLTARSAGRTIKQASAESGLPYSTFLWYRDRYDLAGWKLGDHWPPPLLAQSQQTRSYTKPASEPDLQGSLLDNPRKRLVN